MPTHAAHLERHDFSLEVFHAKFGRARVVERRLNGMKAWVWSRRTPSFLILHCIDIRLRVTPSANGKIICHDMISGQAAVVQNALNIDGSD